MRLLESATATTLVPACAQRTWQALQEVVAELWPGATEALDARPGRLLVLSVHEGGAPDVWLTWRLEPACDGHTRVSLALDELDPGGPPPELDAVLAVLLARCLPDQQRLPDQRSG